MSRKRKLEVSAVETAMERLKASRFRYLNEQLYTKPAIEAAVVFEEDRETFDAYHIGYRQQIEKWPLNPLDTIIQELRKQPRGAVIADMGCGEARLSEELSPKGLVVHSFDLIAANDRVTACNITETPLEAASVEVVVFCLSLMGTNLGLFFREANRILKPKGLLKMAEVRSRFRNVRKFTEAVEKMGFELVNKKELTDYFILATFRKTGKVQQKRPTGLILDPCLYKKR